MAVETNIFQAGVAKVDITPPLGTVINGDFKAHYAFHIHDQLHSKAIVLKVEDSTVVLIVVDICVMPKNFVDAVRTQISTKTGIKFENILISCTHTHAAGSVGEAYLSAADAGYSKKLPGLILESAMLAISKLQPAKIGFGKIDVPEHVRSRRYFMDDRFTPKHPLTGEKEDIQTNPFGVEEFIKLPGTPTDPGLSYLAIQNLNGDWLSVLANYSLHYVGDWANGTISADYFGAFAVSIKDKLNANNDFVGIMSNGTSGDINIWEFINQHNYPSEDLAKSKFIANDLAEKIFQSLANIKWEVNPELNVLYTEVPIQCRKPNAEELNFAKKIVSESNYENLEINQDGLKRIYAREQVLLNEYPASINFPIMAIKIGSAVIGSLGGEIFASSGLRIKEDCGLQNYFTIALANGNCGYVPPLTEFKKGGYETWRSRTSYLEEQAATIIENKLLTLIEKLKD